MRLSRPAWTVIDTGVASTNDAYTSSTATAGGCTSIRAWNHRYPFAPAAVAQANTILPIANRLRFPPEPEWLDNDTRVIEKKHVPSGVASPFPGIS